MSSRRRAVLFGLVVLLLSLACSGPDQPAPLASPDASPSASAGASAVAEPPASTPDADGQTAETTDGPVPLATTLPGSPLAPGHYTSDLLARDVTITTGIPLQVSEAHAGKVVLEQSPPPDGFTAVAFLDVDTFIRSTREGRTTERLAASQDLVEMLEDRPPLAITDSGEVEDLGGVPAGWARFAYTESCDTCTFDLLFQTTGFQRNVWGTSAEATQESYVIGQQPDVMVITIEAPDATFDGWRDEVMEHVLAELELGEVNPDRSLARPAGGAHAVGRAELAVTDQSRTTQEVVNGGLVSVPAAEERQLLLSVAYPSTDGGFGGTPAAGTFPVVLVAPAVRDQGVLLPADRQLAAHGFVVVTIRFPESSFPGNLAAGVPSQPADVTFVLDRVLDGALGEEVSAQIDPDAVGLIGHSGGATTAFGLRNFECCRDDRIGAFVAHAGTVFDFDSTPVSSDAPILQIASQGDQVANVEMLRDYHDATDGPSALAVLELAPHLGWLEPTAPSYDGAFDLVLAFLSTHLRGEDIDLPAVAADGDFRSFDER